MCERLNEIRPNKKSLNCSYLLILRRSLKKKAGADNFEVGNEAVIAQRLFYYLLHT